MSPTLAAGLLTFEAGRPGAPASASASADHARAFVDEAELLGFSHVWLGERRGAWTGYCPSAIVAAGGLLTGTSAIAIATGFVSAAGRPIDELVAETHRLAVTSAGRFEFGVGRGFPDPSALATGSGTEAVDRAVATVLDRWSTLYPRVVLWVSADDAGTVTRAAEAGARVVLPSYLPREKVRLFSGLYREKYCGRDQPTVAVIRDCCLDQQDLAFIREVYQEELSCGWARDDGLSGEVLLDWTMSRVACGSPAEIADALIEDTKDGVDHIVVRTASGGRADLEPLRLLAAEPRVREWLCERSSS
jgi:alkanesulfonate monooxygenase SsuD/methylene tetrahydromethanopterin reductase-like flavin-dependent oxidoreductase (luciferase family)